MRVGSNGHSLVTAEWLVVSGKWQYARRFRPLLMMAMTTDTRRPMAEAAAMTAAARLTVKRDQVWKTKTELMNREKCFKQISIINTNRADCRQLLQHVDIFRMYPVFPPDNKQFPLI